MSTCICPAAIADACPLCHPGIPDGAVAETAEQVNGGTLTSHRCPSCRVEWQTWWDAWGWPVGRQLAPVTPEEAAANRQVLEEALKQDRAGWPSSRTGTADTAA